MQKGSEEGEVLDQFLWRENSLNEVADLIKFQFYITRNPECSNIFILSFTWELRTENMND